MRYPQRIVCLTEETTETLYLLGQGDRVVGVSGYTVRPAEARQKPKVSAFINARFDKILALQPDLVLAFSDLQAELAAELVRRGLTVVTFNQRTVAEILQMIGMLGGLVGCQPQAEALADRLERYLDRIRREAARLPTRPRVFFEDFPDLVLYVRQVPAGGGWNDVFMADNRAGRPSAVYLAQHGRVLLDRQKRTVEMVLDRELAFNENELAFNIPVRGTPLAPGSGGGSSAGTRLPVAKVQENQGNN